MILDNKGPGVIYRLHLTLASRASASTTRVRVYLDGATTPQVDGTMASLAAGTTAPFLGRWWSNPPSLPRARKPPG